MQYVYNKTKSKSTSYIAGSVNDPMSVLMSKLTGVSLSRPRLKTAYNIWGPENRYDIDPIFVQRVREGNVPPSRQAALRSSIYKEYFDALPEEEKQIYVRRAEEEHQEALKKVENALKSGPSTDPADRQRCATSLTKTVIFLLTNISMCRVINGLGKFVEPLLELIADHTGWKVSFIAGGPEPARGGRLNTIRYVLNILFNYSVHVLIYVSLSIHSGVTTGSVKMSYGRSERVAIKEYVLPSFARFLTKCYCKY